MQDRFSGLSEPLIRALESAGFTSPTPIQAQAIPAALEGRDVLGSAQTGSGKTAAFVLPILEKLAAEPARPISGTTRALILAPTRELAGQIGEVFSDLGQFLKLRRTVIFGGVGKQQQIHVLRRGVDILVATPGRLLDLMNDGALTLDLVSILVVDEADRMLDMGFIPDVRRIVSALPRDRQSMFFSATLPTPIITLAREIVRDPVRVEITHTHQERPQIAQRLLFVERENKKDLLADLLDDTGADRTIVFMRTKYSAQNLARKLERSGVSADSLHGNKSQAARQKALARFSSGRVRVLVATDIASRGLDVDDIEHVINFDLPHEPDVYIHRIGRTARAGKSGTAVSFCDPTQVTQLRDIERLLDERIPVDNDHSYHSMVAENAREALEARRSGGGNNGARRSNGQRPNRSSSQRSGGQRPNQSGSGSGRNGQRRSSSSGGQGAGPAGGQSAAKRRSRRRRPSGNPNGATSGGPRLN